MKRLPLLPTTVVTLAVAIMIALGLWQLLDRLPRKQAYLAQLAANPGKPAIAVPRVPDDTLLFRRASGRCAPVGPVRILGAGGYGYRAIADCAEGFGVQLGTTRDPTAQVRWAGGAVSGYLTHAPDTRPLLAGLWDRTPTGLMLVAAPAVAGLGPNRPPDIDSLPNNHLAYAGQWFFFALVASVIYLLALRRKSPGPRP